MSEHDHSDHFGLWLWLVIAWVAIMLIAVHVDLDKTRIRDLQRRVGQLEEQVKR
jgi:hypothetical protein